MGPGYLGIAPTTNLQLSFKGLIGLFLKKVHTEQDFQAPLSY